MRGIIVALLLVSSPLCAQQNSRWLATWAPANMAAPLPLRDSVDRVPSYSNRTVREIVHVTARTWPTSSRANAASASASG